MKKLILLFLSTVLFIGIDTTYCIKLRSKRRGRSKSPKGKVLKGKRRAFSAPLTSKDLVDGSLAIDNKATGALTLEIFEKKKKEEVSKIASSDILLLFGTKELQKNALDRISNQRSELSDDLFLNIDGRKKSILEEQISNLSESQVREILKQKINIIPRLFFMLNSSLQAKYIRYIRFTPADLSEISGEHIKMIPPENIKGALGTKEQQDELYGLVSTNRAFKEGTLSTKFLTFEQLDELKIYSPLFLLIDANIVSKKYPEDLILCDIEQYIEVPQVSSSSAVRKRTDMRYYNIARLTEDQLYEMIKKCERNKTPVQIVQSKFETWCNAVVLNSVLKKIEKDKKK